MVLCELFHSTADEKVYLMAHFALPPRKRHQPERRNVSIFTLPVRVMLIVLLCTYLAAEFRTATHPVDPPQPQVAKVPKGTIPSETIDPVGVSTPPLGDAPHAAPGDFATFVYHDEAGHSMTYYLYSPARYDPTKHYPLVLVLHGGGERASDLATIPQDRQMLLHQNYVQAFVTPSVQTQWPTFVVVPQLQPNQYWVNVPVEVKSFTMGASPSLPLMMALEIVKSLQESYRAIDTHRTYVEGISLGGFGTWEAVERWPSIFAAAIPISGAGDPSHAANARNVAIWAFHSALDFTIPVAGSRLMVQALKAVDGNICYTEYHRGGHEIWNTQLILYETTVINWLFSQTKKPGKSDHPLACPQSAR